MQIYLSSTLASNRKGRFFVSLIQAQSLNKDWRVEPPLRGLLLVQAEELALPKDWQLLFEWSMKPQNAALVLAPVLNQDKCWNISALDIDWQLETQSESVVGGGLIAAIGGDIQQKLLGYDGGADSIFHQVGDIVHTRYIRKHTNSGLFAVTTLPLWSLNLLDHPSLLKQWLSWFLNHSGDINSSDSEDSIEQATEQVVYIPELNDLVALLLIFVCTGMSLDDIYNNQDIKMVLDMETLNLASCWQNLYTQGLIRDATTNHSKGFVVTETGLALLKNSAYWVYVEPLSTLIKSGAQE